MDQKEESKKYCVVIPRERSHHPHDTMAALLEDDGTLAPLRVFDTIDEAVQAARRDKVDHPNRDYEVRPYLGNNTNINDRTTYGRWKIENEVLSRI